MISIEEKLLPKPNTFSVGYNTDLGQDFFDLIQSYRKFVHSYFFSLTHTRNIDPLDRYEVSRQLSECNTYGIPANLLLNTPESEIICDELIKQSKEVVNLDSVSVYSPSCAKHIRNKYPDLTIHLSVQQSELYKPNHLNGIVDCVNISGANEYNNIKLMDDYRKLGIKVKFIVNEGCIVKRASNIKKFPRFNKCNCCNHICVDLANEEPWVNLCRINLYKESLMHFDIDILKFSTRDMYILNIQELLKYWTLPERTSRLYDIVLTDDKYSIFLDWIRERSICSNKCYNCQKCKMYYRAMKGDVSYEIKR